MSLKIDRSKINMMPVFFGPPWGQNTPARDGKPAKKYGNYLQPGEIHAVQVTYETDRDVLEAMIPECYTLNDPYVTVVLCEFHNLGWMGGHGYHLINVNVPVHFKGKRDDLDGDLILVMFENNTDPIIGGRELMAYSKLYCDIPDIRYNDNKYVATADYEGFPLMRMELYTSKPAADPDIIKSYEAKSAGTMHYMYIADIREKEEDPATNWTKSAVEGPVILPKWEKPDDYPYEMRTPEIEYCDGKIEFYKPEWEDYATFGNVAVGLNSLVCKRVIGARHIVYDNACEYNGCYKLR